MDEYIYLLCEFVAKIKELEHLTIKELDSFHAIFSSDIYIIPHLLSLDENQYQKKILQTMEVCVKREGKIRDITLEFLKEFPKYHDYAINYLEKLEQMKEEIEQIWKDREEENKKHPPKS